MFQDVTQDVIVLVCRKTQPNTDYSFKVKTNISDEELKKLDRLDYLELKVSEIRSLVAEADACVFKLYGLDKGEAQVILDSLKINPLYRQTVLKLL